MELIQVNQEKCIRCGICAKVCPMGIISLGEQGPQYSGGNCIACGHCVAVCPEAALDNSKAPLADQLSVEKMPVLDAETAARFLRGRRSIRAYKGIAVTQDKVFQLLNIARLAPTGGNSQGVAYYVFDQPETLRQVTALTIDWMEEAIKSASSWAPYFLGVVEKYRKTGTDVILRGAPCLIVATAAKSLLGRGRDNTHFSLAYAELYAPTIGLGTCWAGFFEACASSGYQPLLDLLGLPADIGVTGGLMVGYPQYTYKRLVDRNPLQVTWQ
jgi:ferredoxin